MPRRTTTGREQADRFAHELRVQRFLQPDDVTCGPTCLRKVYDFYGLSVAADEVLGEIDRNEDGGTLAGFLGIAALRRGFRARIYSYDLRIFIDCLEANEPWARRGLQPRQTSV